MEYHMKSETGSSKIILTKEGLTIVIGTERCHFDKLILPYIYDEILYIFSKTKSSFPGFPRRKAESVKTLKER